MRTYTVRAARPGRPPRSTSTSSCTAREVRQQVPGSGWAAQAEPGQRLTVIGPHAGTTAYGGIEWRPPVAGAGAVRVLLAGDETAVPAIGSILESLPAGYAGHALLEVPYGADVLTSTVEGSRCAGCPATGGRGASSWRGAARGHGRARRGVRARPEALRSSPRSMSTRDPLGHPEPFPGRPTPAGRRWYAWVAGEASVVRDLRRLLVRDLGLDAQAGGLHGLLAGGAGGARARGSGRREHE